ncbi:hypothetical protein CGRA01v4_13310 [Colletotrichum graminicola]|nr:hypothetical protein CGRA01v4_13310 [Colletotrichum graminicola]
MSVRRDNHPPLIQPERQCLAAWRKLEAGYCAVTSLKLGSVLRLVDNCVDENTYIFNRPIFNKPPVYWNKEALDSNRLANGRIARQVNHKASNSIYIFIASAENFSLGKASVPTIAFGDMTPVTQTKHKLSHNKMNKDLPAESGWVKEAPITQEDILSVVQMIEKGN